MFAQRQIAKFLSLAMTAALLLSCAQKEEKAGSKEKKEKAKPAYRFTLVIYDSAGNPFWTKVVKGAEDTAKKLKVSVDIQFAQNDPVKENDMLETAIANKVDGIGVVINYDDAYDAVVKKAMDAKIPVVCFNTDDSQGAKGNARMCYIGQDLETAGYIIAKRLIEGGKLKKDDFVVCPVEHPEAVYAAKRYAGAKKAFDEAGVKSEVLNSGAVSLEDTLNKITQYLLGHKETDAVLGLGGMPLEMAPKAVEDAKMSLPTAGFDLSKPIAENIKAGKTLAAVDQQPYYQGVFTVTQLYYYCKYALAPCDINTGGAVVDQSNVDRVIDLADTVR